MASELVGQMAEHSEHKWVHQMELLLVEQKEPKKVEWMVHHLVDLTADSLVLQKE